MNERRNTGLLIASAFIFSFSVPAFSYIDGGTGSMIMQVAIAGLLGSMYFARNAIGRVAGLFKRRDPHKS